ncbi:AAA domain-containing protein [Micrococcales bacterium KH10]|nr:AAA domain-containing protein [Micrococcales bacterium KH10]
MKIINLQAENIRGLKAIDITPGDNFVELAGSNGAGKSSVLDAIWLALGGKDAKGSVTTPLRKGEKSGFVELDLGNLRVRRNFTEAGTTSLKVTAVTAEGIASTVSSPQTVLDSLRSKFLDPAGFAAAKPEQQRAELLGLLDLDVDLDELAANRKRIFDARTEIGRQGKALGEVGEIDDGLPEEEQSASEIIRMIQARQERNREIEEAEREVADNARTIEDLAHQIQELQAQLKESRDEQKKAIERAKFLGDAESTDELEEQLARIEETNAKIRVNNARRQQLARKVALRQQYETLTRQIENLDKTKDEAIAKANLPVEGLGLDEKGVTLNGLPLSDASSGEQLYAALRITAALNPTLRVIQLRDGSLLDAEHKKIVADFAEAEDYQVWYESVGTGGEGAVIITDGEVSNG